MLGVLDSPRPTCTRPCAPFPTAGGTPARSPNWPRRSSPLPAPFGWRPLSALSGVSRRGGRRPSTGPQEDHVLGRLEQLACRPDDGVRPEVVQASLGREPA